MADDELKLRITPEVDEDALKRIEEELDRLNGKVPIPGKGGSGGGGGGKGASDAIKKDIQTRIEVRELEVRKIQQAAAEEIKFLQQRAAQGKITTTQMASDIQLVENAQVQANDRAIASFNSLQAEILNTKELTEAQSTALQKKLLLATDRVNNNFVSMSRSMGTLTSNTKSANIAFANFGRIVQDAPFGLLGISNNIDPLLNSFAQLKRESTSTGAALLAMGKQLLGPAGLIFLLGSALPTALLFLQEHMRKTKGEADGMTQAISSLREQMAKEFAQAAATMGIDELNRGLSVSTFQLEEQQKALKAVETQMTQFALSGMAVTESQREQARALREQRDEIKANILDAQANVDQFTTQIALLRQRQKVEQDTAGTSIARAKEERQAAEEEKKRLKIAIENYGIMENLRSLQIAYNDDLANSLNEVVESARRVDAELATSLRSIANTISSAKDELINDDFDFDRAVKAEERLGQMRIDMLRMSGDEEAAIVEEGERRKRDAKMELLKLGITDKKAIDQELAMIDAETQNAIKANEKTVAQARADEMLVYADAVSAGLGAIFGENKAVQSAQVVIDTIAGANKAFTGLMPNFPLAVAAAASVTAQGISALRKINSSTKKSKSLGGSGSASASVASATQKPFVTDAISPSGANIAGRIGAMNNQPQFNVTATVDRMGLALAVRDGESDISTRQIPFAS
jgi:hypothetical protein